MATDLRAVNTRLWDIEDEIRDCERNENLGDCFIGLARVVYHTNDRRAAFHFRAWRSSSTISAFSLSNSF